MSITSSLVLVLLCYFHACNARSLGVVNKEHGHEFHSQKQENDDKLNDTGVSIQHDSKCSLPKLSEGVKKEEGSKDHGNKGIRKAKGGQIQMLDVAQNKSLASVSWRVPNKKREDPEAGFNLDYLPPKTHPPIHN